MRKLIIVASTLALAACAGEADVAEEEAPAEEVAEAVDGPVGNYTFETDEGDAMSATIGADGTTEIMNAEGEVVDSGTWAQNDEGATCFVMAEMEEGADPYCMTFGEPDENGVVETTDPEGETDTVTLVD